MNNTELRWDDRITLAIKHHGSGDPLKAALNMAAGMALGLYQKIDDRQMLHEILHRAARQYIGPTECRRSDCTVKELGKL